MNQFCSFCGAALPAGTRFCEGCGSPVPSAPPAAKPATTTANAPTAKASIAAALGVGVALAGMGGWYWWQHREHPAAVIVNAGSSAAATVPPFGGAPSTAEPATPEPLPRDAKTGAEETPLETTAPKLEAEAPSSKSAAAPKPDVPEPPPVPLLPPVPAEQEQAAVPPPSQGTQPAAVPAAPQIPPAQIPIAPTGVAADSPRPLAQAPYQGPLSGTLNYAGPPVVQNAEVVFDGLPPSQLNLVYDEKAWDAHLQPGGGNTQRLILRSKKPGTQKKCKVQWNAVQ